MFLYNGLFGFLSLLRLTLALIILILLITILLVRLFRRCLGGFGRRSRSWLGVTMTVTVRVRVSVALQVSDQLLDEQKRQNTGQHPQADIDLRAVIMLLVRM